MVLSSPATLYSLSVPSNDQKQKGKIWRHGVSPAKEISGKAYTLDRQDYPYDHDADLSLQQVYV